LLHGLRSRLEVFAQKCVISLEPEQLDLLRSPSSLLQLQCVP
jgi:hypothetical protein